ncbi:hypothetical protein JOD45_001945 [Scopulibacillus daqui]|uniref:Spore germination protein GerPA/GerPF n=1 Tax=Scopulibacillus daqui TaxID=1469162 RepID=A0ABS2Q0R7_9BACL|nr:hypothetical protein [Scopulibacillus daqui]MBM7645726.1 hypothetical protein [Scopulibacillus daqui]
MIFSPMTVNLLGFKVNSMDRSSTIAFGPIQQADFYQSTKRNQAYGEQNGDAVAMYLPVSTVFDPDLLDMNSQKNSLI